MKNLIDKMLVVFPFEVDLYRAEGIDAEFVGHPLLEEVMPPQEKREFCMRYGFDDAKPIVGLFPGSRKQEIERIFPVMIGAARMLHQTAGAQIAVGVSSILDFDFMKSFLRDDVPIQLIQHATHDIMKNVDLALVTSGTATLETGFFKTPMIVVYKTSSLTYFIGRMLVRVKNIGLVNIVAGKRVVPELLQWKVTPKKLAEEALSLLNNKTELQRISSQLSMVREKLGTPGASARVAYAVIALT
jgi:lipid-A-disaccharide synthase